MLGIILSIGLIFLGVALIAASKRKQELTEIQTRIAQEEYKQKRKPIVHKENLKEKYDALSKLKELLDEGVLTEDEFKKEKENILSKSVSINISNTSMNLKNLTDSLIELDENEIIEELAKKGYIARKKGIGKWRIKEPLGGHKICNSFQELEDYTHGVLS